VIGVDEEVGSKQDQGSTINSCQLNAGGKWVVNYRKKRIDQKKAIRWSRAGWIDLVWVTLRVDSEAACNQSNRVDNRSRL
jgi:hypothetical protein